ncbi:hypothetical protein Tco_1263521 [Tanacetum coccineum]
MRWYDYGYLEEIVIRRDDNVLYKFKEGDFPRLNLCNIKDMLLLLVEKKMSNLDVDDRYDLHVALRMFTRRIVILHRVQDLQLGVESYQKKLNVTRPETTRSNNSKLTITFHIFRLVMSSDNASELPKIDPYEEVAQQGQTPSLSPAYVPDPMELDEHVPVYVPKLKHPEYYVPSDDDIQVEDQPYANDALPIAESPGHIADLESMEEDSIDYPDEPEDDDEDPEEDLEEDHTDYPTDGEDSDDEPSDDDDDDDDTDDEDEDPTEDEEEEEHLAPADSCAIPVVDPVPSAKDTEAFKTDEARKTVRLEPPMSASMEARIAEHAASPIPPTSPAYDQAPLGYRAAMIRMRDDIPEEDMPLQRRFVLTAPPPGCDVA